MKKNIALVSCFLLMMTAMADINVTLDFSTDNGKTWQPDFPILKLANPTCRVRATFKVNEPTEIKDNVATTFLYSTDQDFASANQGLQWGWAVKKAYYQRPKQYYANARTGAPFIYELNLGKRPANTMGYNNKWDKAQKKFISAPLAPCSALPAGSYKFHLRIGYYTSNNVLSQDIQSFDVVIEE